MMLDENFRLTLACPFEPSWAGCGSRWPFYSSFLTFSRGPSLLRVIRCWMQVSVMLWNFAATAPPPAAALPLHLPFESSHEMGCARACRAIPKTSA